MLVRKLTAEFIGAFVWVFVGCGAIVVQGVLGGVEMKPLVGEQVKGMGLSYQPAALLSVALAFGLSVAVAIYAFRFVSFHFNPAVTLGLACVGRFPWRYVPAYWLAQFAGALVGGLFLWGFPEGVNVNFGATVVSLEFSFPLAFLLEAVLTFLLMLAFMAVATDIRFPAGASGIAIGMVLVIAFLFAGTYTGASLNPARSLATAVVAHQVASEALRQVWLYLLAPAIGAVAGAFLYEFLRPAEFAKSAPEDLLVPAPSLETG